MHKINANDKIYGQILLSKIIELLDFKGIQSLKLSLVLEELIFHNSIFTFDKSLFIIIFCFYCILWNKTVLFMAHIEAQTMLGYIV